MIRAGVFIGVDQSGNLHPLNDAAAGAARMHAWALAQGMDPALALLITDAGGNRVTADQIYRAIEQIVDGPGVEQLILYFAGHGVNLNRGEQWLLSEAPRRTGEAVNVAGSVELARYCGIPHVVVISDACRVAPEGIQAQNVRGVDVFPNDAATGQARPVDQFFACCLGRTAAELRDPKAAAGTFRALYTGALLDGLYGRAADIVEREGDACYVRPRPLQRYLEEEVKQRVSALGLKGRVNQEPDAIITSHDAWLARIELERGEERVRRGGDRFDPLSRMRGGDDPGGSETRPATLQAISRALVHSAAADDPWLLERGLEAARMADVRGARRLAYDVERLSRRWEADPFPMRCGIRVRGERTSRFFAPGAEGEMLSPWDVRIGRIEGPAASVVLWFGDGSGTVVPVMKDFVSILTFDGGELMDVAYEPAEDTPRGSRLRQDWAQYRSLRAVAASAAQHGRFRLEGDDALRVARRMQHRKSVDPSFAVYAAYAYHDLGDVERIRQMSGYLRDDVGATWFDLVLLGRMRGGDQVFSDEIFPFAPLLSQGWALLSAHRVHLPRALRGIEETLRPSLWSLYDQRGADQLAEALHSGEAR